MSKKEKSSDISKILGSNIKKIRKEENISQEQLAEKIGKSSHFISLVERGASGLSTDTVIAICTALNTDANSIFNGTINTSKARDNFLNKSFETFAEQDKDIVSYLITYIINSKK